MEPFLLYLLIGCVFSDSMGKKNLTPPPQKKKSKPKVTQLKPNTIYFKIHLKNNALLQNKTSIAQRAHSGFRADRVAVCQSGSTHRSSCLYVYLKFIMLCCNFLYSHLDNFKIHKFKMEMSIYLCY